METTSKSSSLSNGLTFGLIAGLVYCISLYARYSFNVGPIGLAALSLVFYFVILGVLVFCGITRKKQLGGYIDMKEAFQTIFIAVIIAELIYVVFNFIYLKFIDPGYLDRLKASMETFFENSGLSDSQKEKQMELMEQRIAKQKNIGFGGVALGYLLGVAITGICGLLISLAIRKKKPIFDQLG